MSDALPFPASPNLEQYKNVAKEFQRACRSADPTAIRQCAIRVLERLITVGALQTAGNRRPSIEREADRMTLRWRTLHHRHQDGRCLLANAQLFVAREHGFASWPRFARHIEMLNQEGSPVANFEAAVDAIVGGN